MTRLSRRAVAVRLCLVGIAALGVAAGVYVIATTSPTADSIYPKCFMHSMTGLHCPGCGTGRAAHFMLNGQPFAAIQYNLFAPVVLPFLAVAGFRSLLVWAFDWRETNERRARAVWLWLLAASLITYGIIRNIPVEPFSRLAPQEVEQVSE